jgi:hypothetical protein
MLVLFFRVQMLELKLMLRVQTPDMPELELQS